MKLPNSKSHSDCLQGIYKKLTPDETRLLSEVICQDPFNGLYKKAFIIYAISLSLILLWPFDFTFIGKKNQVTWSDDSSGIEFTGEGQAISHSFSKPLYEILLKGRGLSLEIWIEPANNEQGGPARIVSYSLNNSLRNFTLGQEARDLIIRLRTEKTNLNGMEPMLIVRDVFARPKPLHIVVSYNYQKQKVFVNGSIRVTSDNPGGDLRNWAPEYWLILGNEATGDRPWLGKISYVAIYNYPLDDQEARRSYYHVKNWISGTGKMVTLSKRPVVRYLLDEKNGTRVTDSGTLEKPLTLHIPDKIETRNKPFLEFSIHQLSGRNLGPSSEMILNVLLFIPFGFLLHAVVATQIAMNWRTVIVVIAAGGGITISVEILHYFSQLRHSSLVDVLANLIGVLLGIQLKLMYDNCLKRNKKIG